MNVGIQCCGLVAVLGVMLAALSPVSTQHETQTGQTVAARAHDHPILALAITSDGSRLALADSSNAVTVLNTKTGKSVRVYQGPIYRTSAATSVAPGHDGKQIFTGHIELPEYGVLRAWDVQSGQKLFTLDHAGGLRMGRVFAVAVSPDGSRIACNNSAKVELWEASSGKWLQTFAGHQKEVAITSIAFLANGKQLVSGSADRSIRVWDTATGRELKVLTGHLKGVSCLAISPQASRIVSGSHDGTVRIWDPVAGKEEFTLKGHDAPVLAVATSADGKMIFSGDENTTIRVWDAATGKTIRVLRGHSGPVSCLALSSDQKWLFSGSHDKTLRIWDIASGKAIRFGDKLMEE